MESGNRCIFQEAVILKKFVRALNQVWRQGKRSKALYLIAIWQLQRCLTLIS